MDNWGHNPHLAGGFKHFLCSPQKLGKIPILTHSFEMGLKPPTRDFLDTFTLRYPLETNISPKKSILSRCCFFFPTVWYVIVFSFFDLTLRWKQSPPNFTVKRQNKRHDGHVTGHVTKGGNERMSRWKLGSMVSKWGITYTWILQGCEIWAP